MSGRVARPKGAGVATWSGFVLMCLGMFMAILDIQIVASSLPDIQAALGIPSHSLSWIQTAYLIAEVIAIPLTGWLTRLLTLRGMFAAATASCTARLMPTPPIGDMAWAASPIHNRPGRNQRVRRSTTSRRRLPSASTRSSG